MIDGVRHSSTETLTTIDDKFIKSKPVKLDEPEIGKLNATIKPPMSEREFAECFLAKRSEFEVMWNQMKIDNPIPDGEEDSYWNTFVRAYWASILTENKL